LVGLNEVVLEKVANIPPTSEKALYISDYLSHHNLHTENVMIQNKIEDLYYQVINDTLEKCWNWLYITYEKLKTHDYKLLQCNFLHS
jgi:hypothetical protein